VRTVAFDFSALVWDKSPATARVECALK